MKRLLMFRRKIAKQALKPIISTILFADVFSAPEVVSLEYLQLQIDLKTSH